TIPKSYICNKKLLSMDWFKTREFNGKKEVFDPIRKKYYQLSPEEEVRQITLHWLVEVHQYPAGLLAVEYPITLNRLKKRCDIVVFSNHGKALLIVECKARGNHINQSVLDQAVRYNMKLHVQHLILTNIETTYILKLDEKKEAYHVLTKLPAYAELIQAEAAPE
ncbi:type I restriction enzyme HsdR N-terminal domain-containing protein, partial [Arthrospira platensis SPKY1]|nr:type I restriction enzyme HsdR N-terminal domain-containing protein [Arthrospira platensis SPKY1]